MVLVQFPPQRVPIVETHTGRPTLAFIDFLERLWRRTGGGVDSIEEIQDDLAELAPPGGVQFYGGTAAPAGWLLCDGSEVVRAVYPNLFAAIGTTWGAGDGANTFRVPDLRGRTPVGIGTGNGLTARSLAVTGGAETHALLTAELATHAHAITDSGHTHAVTDGGHTHAVTDAGHFHGLAGNKYVNDAAGSEYVNTSGDKGTLSTTTGGNTTGLTVDSATTGATVDSGTTGITVSNEGSGTAHENMQPFVALTAIIKT